MHVRAHAVEVSIVILFRLIPPLGCKKDHTRTDYRKEEKNRPGVWYLIIAVLMMIVDLLLLYEITNVFFYSKETLCKEAIFADTINIGRKKDENEQTHWIGV